MGKRCLVSWALVWLGGIVSLNLLHDSSHELAEGSHHHCLICDYGQPASPATSFIATAAEPPRVYRRIHYTSTGREVPLRTSLPGSLILRGPPL